MISKELDKANVPVAMISALFPLAEQVGASRIVKGVRIPHPCGDPSLPTEVDSRLRRDIVETALNALQEEVVEPTVFFPNVAVKA